MTTAAQLVAVVNSQIGYVEGGGNTGEDGNLTRYWALLDPSLQGASWCGAFVDYCWREAGQPFPAIDRPYGFINCQDAVDWAKAHGLWSQSGHYALGDTVFYNFAGGSDAEHTGIVLADGGNVITTAEGNTSPGTKGSQANGGGVYRKRRPHSSAVLGVLTSSRWLKAAPVPTPAPKPPIPVRVLEDDMRLISNMKDAPKPLQEWSLLFIANPATGAVGRRHLGAVEFAALAAAGLPTANLTSAQYTAIQSV